MKFISALILSVALCACSPNPPEIPEEKNPTIHQLEEQCRVQPENPWC